MDENFAMGYAMGQDNNNNNGDGLFGGGAGGWLGILLLIALLGGGGLGFGGFGGFGGGAGLQGMATRADINEGFALNNITSGIQAIQQGICDSTYALNNAIQGGFNATQMGMMQGFNGVERGFCDLSHQLSDCCCTTQRAIDGVNYNMATQTNALQQAMCTNTRDIIDSQQAGTRAIIDFLTQDKISTLTAENQALKFAASQAQQYGRNLGITGEERLVEFYAAMNAMQSDYWQVAKKFGVDKPEFYACMAKAFIEDPDAVDDKVAMYYECIAKKQ